MATFTYGSSATGLSQQAHNQNNDDYPVLHVLLSTLHVGFCFKDSCLYRMTQGRMEVALRG